MIHQQTIPCPACQGQIIFDAHSLLQGKQFLCSSCGAAVGIAAESIEEATSAMTEFNNLKAGKNKPQVQ